jgi:DNA polymerase III epsilon subunit-like protein
VTAPATLAASVAALWAQLRLVVLDVETTAAEDGLHVVEIAVVICRGGKPTSRTWVSRVNPGVPVNAKSQAVHGITDEDLADEPPFAAVAPELTRRLHGLDEENVVVVAHNAGFDVSVLRREYARLGQEMPDLLVLDTQVLPRHVGVRPASGRLPDLLAALGLSNPAAHTAARDAEATAEAVIALLERAAAGGHQDFDALHANAMRSRSRTTAIRPAGRRRAFREDDDPDPEVDLPEAHTAAHAEVLTEEVPSAVAAWRDALTECAQLRCPYAADRVAVAAIDPDEVRTAAEAVLDRLLTGFDGPRDVPAIATIVSALAPLLAGLPGRPAALRWHDRWAARLDPLGRCDREGRSEVRCPDCRAGRPCPLDTWREHLAVAARGSTTPESRKSFLRLSGVDLGRGVLTTWLGARRRLLAEAAAWLVYQEHRATGQLASAEMFARYAHVAGAREPRLVAAYANLLAAPGSVDALERAISTCDEAYLSRSGSTAEGWTQLAAKRGQLLGRLTRLRLRPSGELDDDGNPIPVRRHHPAEPRRTRALRFVVR